VVSGEAGNRALDELFMGRHYAAPSAFRWENGMFGMTRWRMGLSAVCHVPDRIVKSTGACRFFLEDADFRARIRNGSAKRRTNGSANHQSDSEIV
jgi:hypothetical protein